MRAGNFEADDRDEESEIKQTPEHTTKPITPAEVKPPKAEPSASKKNTTGSMQYESLARKPPASKQDQSPAPSSQRKTSIKKPTPSQQPKKKAPEPAFGSTLQSQKSEGSFKKTP